jgi:hypothetical protein
MRLEQACGGSLIPRVSGDPPCYSLAGQTILWTDVDACEQFIRHAVNTSETQDALRSWEDAYALLQHGVLLAHDQASYWYEARFVQDRCKKLARQRTQCVLRIADLCCVCGDLERAVTVLEAESEAHPAHEEVVFQLMNLLANQGRSSEALQYFTCLETALLEKDAEPREETKVLAHRLRTTGTTKQGTSSILGSARLQDQMVSRGHAADRIGTASQLPALLETKGPFEHRRADWGEALSPEQFYGRDEELTRLKTWIVEDHGRLVSILGMGGIGKTSLAVVLASQLQGDFEYVFWRSLYNAPLLPSVLQDCIKLLSDQQRTDLPDNPDDQIALLIEYLRVHRCLLILDNVETILQGGTESGSYREGYEGYKKVFQRIGETRHDSCLLLTSREKPPEVALLEGKLSPVRSQHLSGVGQQEGRELLSDKGLFGSDHAWSMLIHLYAGNPLALKLISEPIRELFNANIDEFLKEEHTVVGNIHELLDQQFQRLPARERDIMYWLR